MTMLASPDRTASRDGRMAGHVFVNDDVLTAPSSSYSEQVTLDLGPGVSITLPLGLLKGYALLAYTEPVRRRTDGVHVPKTWLVGERIGY